MKRGKRYATERGAPLWLITFTDVMALMLTFFVLLYSMSAPQEEEWNEITNGLQNQFTKTFAAEMQSGAQDAVNIDKIDFSKAQSLSYLESVIANAIARNEKLKDITMIPQRDALIISVPDRLLFETGEANVSDGGKETLFALGGALTRIRNRIEVIGHTDPRPAEPSDKGYNSNWALSLARAGAVSAMLESGGYQKPMTIRGLSSARYGDLSKDVSDEERLSYARRVDIVVMKDDGQTRTLVNFDMR